METDNLCKLGLETEPALAAERERLFATGSPYLPARRAEIVGLEPVLDRLDEVAGWLQTPELYLRHGARLEPGILLAGPPGTGKTLLARYLATQAEALFVDVRDFPCSGPTLAASDVATLFAYARSAYATIGRPTILFWDELDASVQPSCSPLFEEETGLEAALRTELDGLRGKPEGVLLVACTNRPERIGPALVRPGRLGLRFELRPPDAEGRALLLAHYLRRYPTDGPIDAAALACLLASGDTAPAIEEAVAGAWRRAVARAIEEAGEPLLLRADVETALLERLVGPAPPFWSRSACERMRIAVHECGHALCALAFDRPLQLVSVAAGRDSLGRVLTGAHREALPTLDDLYAELRVGLGGIAAERVAGISASASGAVDTLQASELALRLVEAYGAGRTTGLFNPDASSRRRATRTPELSETMLARYDEAAARLVEEARRDATRVLRRAGRRRLVALAELLAERETMTGAEFEAEARRLLGDPFSLRRRRRAAARPAWVAPNLRRWRS